MQEAPSSSEGLIEKKDSDSRLSNVLYDSLNSPYLPTKYLSQDTSNSNQQQLSPEGLPHLTNGTESRLPPGIAPTSHSLPQKSNSTSGTSLVECTGLHCDAEPTSVYPPRSESDRGRRERWRRSHSKKDSGALGQENGHGEGGGNAEMEQLLNLEATEQVCGDVEEQSHAGMLSDLSDISSSDEEIHLHSNEAALSAVLSDESEHSGGHSVNVMCSPDSYHLQEAKKNLKRAKDFGYSVNNSSSGGK